MKQVIETTPTRNMRPRSNAVGVVQAKGTVAAPIRPLPMNCQKTSGSQWTPVETAKEAASRCVETFGVALIDPVNPYVLSDRAIKYGLLFIVLTFVAVAMVEVLKKCRVHPIQYLLVGCGLSIFFLLLVSLSEHLSFGLAYALALAEKHGLGSEQLRERLAP